MVWGKHLSLGGVLALNYTIDHPEKVNSLVLIATQYKMPKGILKIQNILFQFMPKSMFSQTGFGKKEFIQLCKTMMELAGSLKDAELQIISDSGHEVNIETPEKLAEVLRVFYKQV